ncbi:MULTISPECIES: tRNA (adenosine(37)-N6)-dimethylallyltransferase MiaA [Gammaproteobacteria]|uniref:tRNA (adenosine(37)-N6)-dimethylallyltransferase MiaA n=1 Tax=Gammaproteobacteria TaxID=1236 RepID=UPI000DD09B6F|nr:tRNA (adenosine(37)-N6)-dimethylallyltransferase MiaA [Aliidiomarina sp. B3213]TCZ91037.1 tRNA (adenosine(37)-N6)-dimethylallyltransferase MiaA [Lysobacter sp. N42]
MLNKGKAVNLEQGVICISGPTAAGKTSLAMELFDRFPCEIVSVDSALIYRGMDIGTAKPTAEELERYPHHLVNILDPLESYSAADFASDAETLIHDIRARGNTPVLVGGTMLYYKALLAGMSQLPTANQEVRQEIQERADSLGWQVLYDELKAFDPTSAERIHPNDPQRLMRALEVYKLSGKSLTELTAEQKPGLALPTWQIAVAPQDRSILHKRIEQRFDLMLADNFQQEVEALRARGDLHLDLPSMRCVGYRQMWQYLDGEMDYDTMREKGIIATRQLAKRQMTWLRSWPALNWIDPLQGSILDHALKILQEAPTSVDVWKAK